MASRYFNMNGLETTIEEVVEGLTWAAHANVTSHVLPFVADDKINSQYLWRAVEDECERMTHYYQDAMCVIAYYGLSDALKGGVDLEDSPLHQFEDDVYGRVEAALTEEGIEIVD